MGHIKRCIGVTCAAALALGLMASAQADTIAYWQFEPGSNFLADSSSNGYNLVQNTANGVIESTDTPGGSSFGSASFDGTGLHTSKTLDLRSATIGTNSLTIEWFMKPVEPLSTTATQVIVEQTDIYSTANKHNGAFLVDIPKQPSGNPSIQLVASQRDKYNGNYYQVKASNVIPNPAQWTEYAVTIDSSKADETRITMYVNYQKVGTGNLVGATHLQPLLINDTLYIGERGSNPNIPYSGLIDEMRISSGILTPDQFLWPAPQKLLQML